ncbi:MAG TPA: nicotinate (nicotinamide) nucleotide adenylyltransferase [Candidatus Pacebacteria bacterium]|nr:nicotinate (nicotinamide) nucleotide adenylyltransferase [Candidatus Paceibacterota bacterium]
MNIILFGGAFDPPHLGHQQIAANLLAENLADEVWFVPVKQHSFAKQLSLPIHRLKLLQLQLLPKTKIELYEQEQVGINYTYNTLDALSARYSEHKFSWVIGSDNLAKFYLWGDASGRNYQALLKSYPFYVYPRHGFRFEPLHPGMISLPHFPEIEVSSTQVRARIAAGQTLTGFVTPAVADYIRDHQLYQAN